MPSVSASDGEMRLLKRARITIRKDILREFSDAVRLGSLTGGERIWELTQKFAAKLGGRGLRQEVWRRSAKLLDGRFEAGKEGFTGFATIEVLLQFLAEGIIELLVEIVGELSEESFAGGGPSFAGCRDGFRTESGFLWSRCLVIQAR